MNKRQIVTLSFIILVSLLSVLPAYSSIPEFDYLKQPSVTDKELNELAIEEGIVPYNADKAYFADETNKKNSVAVWVLMKREDKIDVIDNLKKMFKEKENVVIGMSSVYYADEINKIIFNSIKNNDINTSNKRGLGVMFKTIAVMDGDFDNGKNKIETMRKYFGEELFEAYKSIYPDKYKQLQDE